MKAPDLCLNALLLGALYGTLFAAKQLDPDAPFELGPPPLDLV